MGVTSEVNVKVVGNGMVVLAEERSEDGGTTVPFVVKAVTLRLVVGTADIDVPVVEGVMEERSALPFLKPSVPKIGVV